MQPRFVRELSDPERQTLQVGLRSSDGFTVRRCHILLASARGDTTTVIAQAVGCSPQAVRTVLRGFETRGLAVVALQSRRPHTAAKLFDPDWGVGYADEVWWSRLAQPAMHAWGMLRLHAKARTKDDPQPKALAGSGLLRTDQD